MGAQRGFRPIRVSARGLRKAERNDEAPRNSQDAVPDQPAIQAQPKDPNALSQRLLKLFKLTCPIITVVLLITILILCVVLFNRIKRSPTARNRPNRGGSPVRSSHKKKKKARKPSVATDGDTEDDRRR